jgi:pyridoxal phosphate enzyme (YggS family)
MMSHITENVKRILAGLPDAVELVAAAKTRSPREVMEAVAAGVKIIGENYVQEAEAARTAIGDRAQWHFIGHLQKNKVRKAVELFDMIETVDSAELAALINRRAEQAGKLMPVLIEVNSGREPQKSGVLPEETEQLVRGIAGYEHIRVAGLMTMGPAEGDPENSRPFFRETKRVFDHLRHLGLPGVEMKYLSMGMTNSYRVAIEEGASIVRLGSLIFGERNY